MSRVLRKKTAGEPLVITADAYNQFVDATIAARFSDRQGGGGLSVGAQAGTVWVKNEAEQPVPPYGVLAILSPIVTPAEELATFTTVAAFKGTEPGGSDPTRFAVVVSPLVENEIGPAIISGVTLARIEILDESHEAAEMKAGAIDRLQSAAGGIATILWKEQPTDRNPPEVAWAIIRIGAGGGGTSIVDMKIVTVNAIDFTCRRWNDPVTAPTFLVKAFMRNDPQGEAFTLNEAHPPYFAGQFIRAHKRQTDGGLNWWAIDTFTKFCVQ